MSLLSDDVTLMLLIQAREEASSTIESVNEKIASFVEKTGDASDSASEMGSTIDTSWTGAASSADVLEAQTTALAAAQNAAADAADRLKAANAEVAETSGTDSEALAAQAAALNDVAVAQARVSAASRDVDTSLAAQAEETRTATEANAEASEGAAGLSSGMGKMALVGGTVVAATAMIAKSSIDAANEYQESTARIAASGNMSINSAQKITQAFLTTAGSTTMTAQQLATAYSKVVGTLDFTQGHALSAGQALGFMKEQADLAEASGTSLNAVTSASAQIMQAFKMPVNQAATAENALFVASRDTGTSVTQLATQVTRMKTRLGELAPTLTQTSAMLVDLAHNGETGRLGMNTLNTAMTTLLKTTASAVPTTKEVNTALGDLPKSTQALAKQLVAGTISMTTFSKAEKTMTQATRTQLSQFQSLVSKSQESVTELNALSTTPAQRELTQLGVHVLTANGTFVGMGSVIAQMQPKLEGMSKAQQQLALDALFGQQSAQKLYTTIMAGPKAYDAATKAVEQHDAAQAAAERTTDTFKGSEERLKSAFDDTKVVLGNALMPILTKLMQVFEEILKPVLDFISTHEKLSAIIFVVVGALGALLAIIGLIGMIVPAVTAGFAALGSVMAVVLSPITLIVIAVIALGVAIYELVTHWTTVWDAIKTAALDAWRFIYNDVFHPIMEVAETVITWIKTHWQLLLSILTGPFGAAVIFIVTHWGQIVSFIEGIVNDVVSFFTKLPSEIADALGDVIDTIWHGFVTAAQWITQYVITPVINFFTALPGRIVSGLGDIVSTIWRGLLTAAAWVTQYVISPVLGYFTALPGRIVTALGAIVTTIWSGLTTAATWVYDNVIGPVVGFFAALPGDIGQALSTIWSTITGAFDTVTSWISDNVIDPILNFFKTLPQDILNVLTGLATIGIKIIEDIAHGITSAAGDIGKAITGAISGAFGAIGGAASSALSVIGLATGGLVTSPTLAVIGEAGPEVVVPLKGGMQAGIVGHVQPLPSLSGTAMGTGGGGITIDMRTANVMSTADIQQLADKVGRALVRVTGPSAGVVVRH